MRVLYIARGVGNHERVTNDWVRAKYGIDARQYADFATLRGDASDGLPGVAGVGEKTAATLLGRFGDMDGILAAADDPDSDLGAGPARQDQGGRGLPRGRARGGRGRPRPRPRLPRHHASRPSRATWPGSPSSATDGASRARCSGSPRCSAPAVGCQSRSISSTTIFAADGQPLVNP